jgi:hypothetical protein
MREYLRKHELPADDETTRAPADLGIVVVIPCYDEPDLLPVLESLWRCRRPRKAVEILLVMNASESDDDDLRRRNQSAIDAVHARWGTDDDPRFHIRTLNFPRLPARHAGVGMARKIGMDEAVTRFLGARNPDGVIASLDADCTCDDDYLVALESHFRRDPDTRACTVYFEHPLSGSLDDDLYQAAASYELFLRYYRHGLQYAGTPYAHYTVGSCFAVRCDGYTRHGGMNRREAGEDFYFLNKLMGVGGVSVNNATRVVPGARASTRTPFGTGRALNDRLADPGSPWLTYNPLVFRDLGELVARVDDYYDIPADGWRAHAPLSDVMERFLDSRRVVSKHAQIRTHSASPATFRKRFFQWFDGFMTLKFVHYASDNAYPRVPLEEACVDLLRWCGSVISAEKRPSATELLYAMREADRGSGGVLDT